MSESANMGIYINTTSKVNPFNWIVSAEENMVITKAFDTSRWNHPNDEPIDFAQAYSDGYRIWSGRASVGDYYIDPWFRADFDAARTAGFICVPYHVIAPERPDNLQVEKFIEALDGRDPNGVVIDVELHRDQTSVRITACNRYHADRFKQMYPGRVLLYTSQAFANAYLLDKFGLPLFVANPGQGGGMNYNPEPSLPHMWTSYIAWQKDWEHIIPGVPDTTTDYSEFKMSETEARKYFGMDEQEEDDMSEITEKLDLILENQGIIIAMLDGGGEEPPVVPPVTPPPPVEPPSALKYVKVTAPDHTNARFIYGKNAKGKPIFQIYPGDSSKANERIQYKNGVLLAVYPEKIDGDGDIDCYELIGRMAGDGKQLYAWTKEVMKTW